MLILGISGKKQSGKTTVGNFILSLYLAKLNLCEKIYMDEDGQLIVSDVAGDARFEGIFNVNDLLHTVTDHRVLQALNALSSKVKLYSFADILKTDICMNMLGLTYAQCYGTDEDKNSLTSIRWQDMPGYEESWKDADDYDESGFMTARQVMQFVGTDLFRKMKNDVWVSATLNKIIKEKPALAVITDCRFPNEVESIRKVDGKVIRLTRSPFESSHISEIILDQDKYDWSNFDFVIDNTNTSLLEQFTQIKKLLEEILPL